MYCTGHICKDTELCMPRLLWRYVSNLWIHCSWMFFDFGPCFSSPCFWLHTFWYKENWNAWVSVVPIGVLYSYCQCYSPCSSQFQTPWLQENEWYPWSAIHSGLPFLNLFCRHSDQVSNKRSKTRCRISNIPRHPLPPKHAWRVRHRQMHLRCQGLWIYILHSKLKQIHKEVIMVSLRYA